MNFKLHTSVVKSLVRILIVILPTLIGLLPSEWLNLTISGILMVGFDWLKAKYTSL